jgi:predicted transcriptional regulator
MEELIRLFKKRGIFNTFQVLSLFENFRADKYRFYQKLNKFSNYNSFLRVKDALIKNELLKINYNNGSCYFELTSKGKRMFFILQELNSLLIKT